MRYSLVLRLKFVTGSPEVLSLAPSLPRPCGYLLFKFVQFLYKGGTAASAVPAANATAIETTRRMAIRFIGYFAGDTGAASGRRSRLRPRG